MSNKMWAVIATLNKDQDGENFNIKGLQELYMSKLPVDIFMNFDINEKVGTVTKLKLSDNTLYAYGDFGAHSNYYSVTSFYDIEHKGLVITKAKLISIGLTHNPSDLTIPKICDCKLNYVNNDEFKRDLDIIMEDSKDLLGRFRKNRCEYFKNN